MTPERWNQIENILDRALSFEGDSLTTFLDEACGEDATLRVEVERYINSAANPPAFLEGDAVDFAAPALSDIKALGLEEMGVALGSQVGAYKLMQEVGHGGMSVVYLAERDDGQFKQEVAVKILQLVGSSREELTRRFRLEGQILASLQHPNIAQVLDSGIIEGGWPYLAMPFVKGPAITTFCNDHSLALNDRVKLMETVCEAVQHAHSRLVVHRDLKPTNILVDEAGQPKLLDFGIAKLLDPETDIAIDTVVHTRTGLRLLTPEYAAPEQVRGGEITTATDVYALGVLLYELLTGRRPYQLKGKSPADIEQIVCEKEPSLPSTAATEEDDATSNVLPDRWYEQLRGDLDIIVMKALRKEPDARYGTAIELADDLRRYRQGLPLMAQPATAGYRLQKFLKRHKQGALLTATFIALITAIVGFYTIRVQNERDQAKLEAIKAQEVTDFMLGLFSANELGISPTDTITARTLMARGEERARELNTQPEVQAEMMAVIGDVYRQLGQFDKAEPLLRDAVSALQMIRENATESQYRLAELFRVQGRYAEADSLHRNVLEARLALLGERHESVAASMGALAQTWGLMNRLAEADSLGRLALNLSRETAGLEAPQTLAAMNNLITVNGQWGNFAVAESLHRELLILRKKVLGNNHYEVATDYYNIGYALAKQGKLAEADSFYRAALSMRTELLGKEHPETLSTLGNLAGISWRKGDIETAEAILLDLLARYKNVHGEKHPSIAGIKSNLAVLIGDRGDYEEAIVLHHEILALRRELLGDENPTVASVLINIASTYDHMGKYDEAEKYHRETLAMRRKLFGNQHRAVAQSLYTFSKSLRLQGDLQEAEKIGRESLEILRTLGIENDPEVAVSLRILAGVLRDRHLYADADSLYTSALQMQRTLMEADNFRIAITINEYGISLLRQHAYEDAASLLEEAFAIRIDKLGVSKASTQETIRHLITLYETWNKPEKAEEFRAMLAR